MQPGVVGVVREAQAWDALPKSGFLRDYVAYASRQIDCNVAYHIVVGLCLLTQSAPLSLHFPFGTDLHANLYGLLVGSSGSARKTLAINLGRQILRAAVPSSEGEHPGSWEVLVDALKQNPRQLICYSEFGSLLKQTESNYLAALRTKYIEAFDCSPLGRATVKKRGSPVENPRLSILGGVAPSLLEEHTTPTDWTGGFMSRFLTIFAEREREFDPLQPDVEEAARLGEQLKVMTEGLNSLGPVLAESMSPSARNLWRDWKESVEKRVPANNECASAMVRAPTHALKTALLLAWDQGIARSGIPWRLEEDQLVPAMKIADLHLASVMHLGEHLAQTRDMRDRRTIIEVVGTPEVMERGLSLGEIGKRAKLLQRRVKELVETLLEEEEIETKIGLEPKTRYRRADAKAKAAREAQEAADRAAAYMRGIEEGVVLPLFERPADVDTLYALEDEIVRLE